MPDAEEHLPHLVGLALSDRDSPPRVHPGSRGSHHDQLVRDDPVSFEQRAPRELRPVGIVRDALHLGQILAQHAVTRVRHAQGELAVVGEDNEPFRVVVQTPDRNYSFVIDYIPTVKNGGALPPAVIIDTYRNGASYWLASDAQAAMNACASNLRNARVPVLSAYLSDARTDSSFAVDYAVANVLRPAPEYDVVFNNYQGGKFTFENEAVKNIGAYSNASATNFNGFPKAKIININA